jgi:hypothetical protein
MDELIGSTREVPAHIFGTYTETALYMGQFIMVPSAPLEFQLILPALRVNGVDFRVAPVSFQLRDEYVMTGICP